tara:strand:- start:151 stop:516 length:366 start_codon:yes stop_codon:yes gene_type:complete
MPYGNKESYSFFKMRAAGYNNSPMQKNFNNGDKKEKTETKLETDIKSVGKDIKEKIKTGVEKFKQGFKTKEGKSRLGQSVKKAHKSLEKFLGSGGTLEKKIFPKYKSKKKKKESKTIGLKK